MIAYVLHSTDLTGGSTKAWLPLLEAVISQGIAPIVIVPDRQGVYLPLKERGVDVHVLNYRTNTYPNSTTIKDLFLFFPRLMGRIFLNYMASRRLVAILKEKHVQLVHSNVSVVSIGCKAAYAVGIPHVCHIREYAALIGRHFFPSRRYVQNRLLAPANYNICITRGVQHYYCQQSNPHSSVIYDGVRPSLSLMPSMPRQHYFLYAGRLEPNKGLLDLLVAYEIARSNSPSDFPVLKVVGAFTEPVYVQQVLHFISVHNLSVQVELMGEVSDVDTYMQQALALIVPSHSEGFGFCMVEAMFNGCIVVGNDTTGTKEQFDNGLRLTGHEIGFRYKNQQELVEHLNYISRTIPAFFNPMRTRAFRVVNELYTTDQNTRHILQFYRQIMNSTTI